MGRIEMKTIELPYIKDERKVRIYLPEKYDLEDNLYFPVLYMHDGQNLYFDEEASYGNSWKVKDTMEQIESEGFIDGVIVVGIDSNPKRRLDDYSPWTNSFELNDVKRGTLGGDGHKYGEFIVNTLKPYIDKEYRTLRGSEYTAVAGSSMGGMVSIYLAITYPNVFSKIGAFSTSSWFAEEEFLKMIDNSDHSQHQKFFIQIGTKEDKDSIELSQTYIDCSLRLVEQLIKKGVDYRDIKLNIGVEDMHNEISWAKHFPEFIKFVYKIN